MFTGLIGPMGQVSSREGVSEVKFTIASSWAPDTYVIGESIACDGACMTVVDWADGELGSEFSFIASAETLECTTLSNWKAGRSINLERALRFGDSLGGHLVSGHIDGLAQLTDRTEENGSLRLSFQVTDQHKGFIASKAEGCPCATPPISEGLFSICSPCAFCLSSSGAAVDLPLPFLSSGFS